MDSKITRIQFEWKHGEPKEVLLVGSWDHWTKQLEMIKNGNKFISSIRLPPTPGGEYEYKFLVDGEWCCDQEKPLRADQNGNMNNILNMMDQVEENTFLPDPEKSMPKATREPKIPSSSKKQEASIPQDTPNYGKDFTFKYQDPSRAREPTKEPQQVNKKR